MAATITFDRQHDYSAQSGSGITVPVELSVGESKVRLHAKVDTGASWCIFQREYAEQLIINVEAGEARQFSTATGLFTAFGHEVTISCFDWTWDATVYFSADQGFTRNVVGRNGWLQQFKVAVVDYDSILHLSRYD
jgi:Aspartyl protease